MQVIAVANPGGASPAVLPDRATEAYPAGLARRYVISNQKGGQSKTTTAAGLGAEFAAGGCSVRLIDCDPQLASLTYWFPPQWDSTALDLRYDLFHVLMGEALLGQATWPTTVPGLYIVPSFKSITRFEAERPPGADWVLRQALDEASPFDVTLIDCPPNLGLLTVTALASANDVIIPVLPGALDLAGVSDLSQTMALVRKRLNPALRVTAVALRRIHRTSLGDAIEQQLLDDYPDAVHQVIRHSVKVAEAPHYHQTLRDYAPAATATADYRQFASRLDDAARKARS